MKQRRVWRYRCDHCRKSGCGKAAMRDHEGRCFKNPNRLCPVCHLQWPVAELAGPIAALSDVMAGTEAAMIQAISDVVEHCPACICSAINQATLPTITETDVRWDGTEVDHSHRYHVSWDYAKARDSYRREERVDWGVTSL